jgi:hypothetical protein
VFKLYLDNEKLIKELNQEKTIELPTEYWDEYIKYIKNLYHSNILYNIYKEKNPIGFLKNQQSEYLDEPHKLKNEAYSIQLTNYYINSFEVDYLQFIAVEKPTWITERDYNKLLQYLEDKHNLNMLITENKNLSKIGEEENIKLSMEINNVKELKDKITCQLDFINKLLSDPTVVERIEDYNDLFAKGNFENLEKIAKLINKG